MNQAAKIVLTCLLIVMWSATAFAQAEIRIKLADGSTLVVDEATETPQGVWFRKGNINQLLPKEKVKKIERITAEPAPSATPSANDDDHFEVAEAPVAQKPTS